MDGFIEIATKLLNEWELRALILLSLLLQVMLAVLGSRRKHTSTKSMVKTVALAYVVADSVAVVALGIVTRTFMGVSINLKTKPDILNHSIDSVWAMLMLLHLGGPDTITAYSLVDKELWLRHLLGFFFNFTTAAYYVLLMSGCFMFVDVQASLMAFLVCIAGVVKYVERSFALGLSSIKSLPSNMASQAPAMTLTEDSDEYFLFVADFLYKKLKFLCAGTNLNISEVVKCHDKITSLKSAERAFQMVEFELGLLYDVLYTKANVMNPPVAIPVRCIIFLSTVYGFFALTFSSIHAYNSNVDVVITYILLLGAAGLELYGLVLLFTSDWTKIWLVRHRKLIGSKRWISVKVQRKRWSRTINQCNLMDICLVKRKAVAPAKVRVYKDEQVDAALQQTIFDHLVLRIGTANNLNNAELRKKLLNYRGDFVLDRMKRLEELKWSTVGVDFDHSLLLWHIATDLCYYDDYAKRPIGERLDNLNRYSKISRCLSDYMLYALVKRPKLLPIDIGDIRYRDTCEHARKLFEMKKVKKKKHACHELLRLEEEEEGSSWNNGSTSKSVLFDGYRLAKQLQSLQWPNQEKDKWEMMNLVWVELLTYAASHSEWREHAHRLTKGGELLTHVCLLMAYLGLSEQYYSQTTGDQSVK